MRDEEMRDEEMWDEEIWDEEIMRQQDNLSTIFNLSVSYLSFSFNSKTDFKKYILKSSLIFITFTQ
jgi:hypothetical protein